MNKLLYYSFVIVFTGCLFNCSTDADDNYNPDEKIIGVWEQDGFIDEGGQRLLFEPDYSYFKISRTVFDDDTIVSGIVSHYWEINGNEIIILEDEDIVETFTLNSGGQLISNTTGEMPYTKISNTTSGYY